MPETGNTANEGKSCHTCAYKEMPYDSQPCIECMEWFVKHEGFKKYKPRRCETCLFRYALATENPCYTCDPSSRDRYVPRDLYKDVQMPKERELKGCDRYAVEFLDGTRIDFECDKIEFDENYVVASKGGKATFCTNRDNMRFIVRTIPERKEDESNSK